MSEQVIHDPKFMPDTTALEEVGLSANKLKTDKAVFDLIVSNQAKGDLLEAQNAVAAYVLWQRGHEHEGIAGQVGVAVKTIERWCVAGAAILRTGEFTKTLSAVKANGWMSKQMMDAATKPAGTTEEKLERLATAAVAQAVVKNYEKDTEAEDRTIADDVVAQVVTSLPDVVLSNSEPLMAATMIANIPHVADAFGIRRKQREPQLNDQGAQQVHVHLKAALKDARQIAKDSDAQYVPTADDLKALMSLCQYLNIPLAIDEDVETAIKELAW